MTHRPPATAPVLVLAVHGSRDPRAAATARALARATAHASGARVRVGYADIAAPDVGRAAAEAGGAAVVVPAFLASGYHVRTDIPAQLARAGVADTPVAPALDGEHRTARAAARRLREAGHRPGEAVVLAAAGSSDPRALTEARSAARVLSALVGAPVETGFIATATPTAAEAAARMRRRHGGRVWAASWLLAPGLFHTRLAECGADAVTAPLCTPEHPDPGITEALALRYHRARSRPALTAAAPC
ncbi:sirohydrochlorin chelatase [Nocardiopsis composta]|uniref:Sirohydrochlorin ferrochelatase n=1 Tax=Nocardiopsis composta TaxID=157465 RepID=A0A7W8QHR7_9ACTN|nr:CbiX/SirB N-terminal domain-containing protein [Nocardiopsis composta]MBB5430682.1 sirohydrochlorin ferrochelatase [Nocardiopsis composta]